MKNSLADRMLTTENLFIIISITIVSFSSYVLLRVYLYIVSKTSFLGEACQTVLGGGCFLWMFEGKHLSLYYLKFMYGNKYLGHERTTIFYNYYPHIPEHFF